MIYDIIMYGILFTIYDIRHLIRDETILLIFINHLIINQKTENCADKKQKNITFYKLFRIFKRYLP